MKESSFENPNTPDGAVAFVKFNEEEAKIIELNLEKVKGTDMEPLAAAVYWLLGLSTEKAAEEVANQLEQSA